MTLQRLLRSRRIESRPAKPDEIGRLLESAGHYLKNAQVPGLEPTVRFFVAYPAALDLATVVVRASGYRVKPQGPGHHESTFEAFGDLFGREGPSLARYFQKCRKTRNEVSYDSWIDLTDTEVEGFIKEVAKLNESVLPWLRKNHAALLSPPPGSPPPP